MESWWTFKMGQFDGCLRESLCWVNNLPESKKLKQRKKKQHYQLQTFQKITRRLSGAKVFTKIDGNKGYWKIPLNEATLVVGLIWDYPSDWPDGITDPYFRPWFVKQQQKSAGWRESGAWDDGVIGLFFRA